MDLYCSGCNKKKFAGLFSAAMRTKRLDCERLCMECIRGNNKLLRKRHRGQRGSAWKATSRIILPGTVF
jgi:hypothetical protein